MEEYNSKMQLLREHLAEGALQAQKGQFVEDFSMENLIAEMDDRE